MGTLEAEAEHVEAVTVRPEAEALVERERGSVLDLGVHERELDPAAAHPVQPVEHEGASDAGPLVARVDGQPLDIAAPSRPSGHRVRGEPTTPATYGRARNAKAGHWGGRERVVEAAVVDAPEGLEGECVDCEHGGALRAARSSDELEVDIIDVAQDAKVVYEKAQVLPLFEAGVDEPVRLLWRQRARDDLAEPAPRERVSAPADERRAQRGGTGKRHELGHAGVARSQPGPLPPPLDDFAGPHHAASRIGVGSRSGPAF